MRALVRSFAATLLMGLCAQSALAAWPEDRPIEILVGFAPGGGTDVMVRNMVPFLEKYLGGKTSMIVVNRPGAASEISNAYLARARPDGYTVAIVNVPALVFVPMYKKAQYDPAKIQLVARVLSDPTVLVVKRDSKYASLKDAVADARRSGAPLSFGHNGIGTNGHLALLQLQTATGVTLNEIPFNGTAQSKTALLGGHIDMAAMTTGEMPDRDSPQSAFRILAQLSATRLGALSNVPTATEQGVQAVMPAERGFAAPRGTEASIAARLQDAIEKTIADPAFRAKASNDAPVLNFLPGSAWDKEIEARRPLYQQLARMVPKD